MEGKFLFIRNDMEKQENVLPSRDCKIRLKIDQARKDLLGDYTPNFYLLQDYKALLNKITTWRANRLNVIRVAMVYSSGNARMNGTHPIKTAYYFFQHAMLRNKKLMVEHLDALRRVNISKLKKDYDVVVIPYLDLATSLALRGIKDSNIPVIVEPGDPQSVLRRDMIGLADSVKPNWFFDFYAPESFYKYYPKRFKYEVVHIGLEPSLYTNAASWDERVSDKIAISGALDKPDIIHKIYYRIYLRRPKALSSDFYYKLRTRCNKIPYVIHTRDIYPQQSTDQLCVVLSRFKAAIAAMTVYPTIKYKETPAAGCLTFMESTSRNYGVSHLGFKDGKNAIFIDESNYLEKFQEYLDSQDDPKWKKIAQEGRMHALKNLSNDAGVEMLINIMRKALGEKDIAV